MRNHLLRLLFIIALHTCSTITYGQSPGANEPRSKIPEPLYILNSAIIGNGLITHLEPKNIKGLVIYKGKDEPSLLKNLTSAGIIAITYDGEVRSQSFAEVGSQYGVHSPFRVVINGHMLNAAQQAELRIAPEAIGQVQVTQATPGKPEALVDIKLIEYKSDTQKHAPGTIMIR